MTGQTDEDFPGLTASTGAVNQAEKDPGLSLYCSPPYLRPAVAASAPFRNLCVLLRAQFCYSPTMTWTLDSALG